MSAWTTPKTNWNIAQPEDLKGADLNRIEGNTNHLYNRTGGYRVVSGMVGSSLESLNQQQEFLLQQVSINVPISHRLYRINESFCLNHEFFRLVLKETTYVVTGSNSIQAYSPNLTSTTTLSGRSIDGLSGISGVYVRDAYNIGLGVNVRTNNDPSNRANIVVVNVFLKTTATTTTPVQPTSGWSIGYRVMPL